MIFNFLDKKIDVKFIDEKTGKIFAQSKIPQDKLPETFACETTMDIQDSKWRVTKAEPLTADEFRKTGELSLTVVKIEMLDPNDLLFSLPTINDGMPQSKKDLCVDDFYKMHEDDWRQVEFIDKSQKKIIDVELKKIKEIYDEKSVKFNDGGIAFKEVYLRKSIPCPLVSRKIAISDLMILSSARDKKEVYFYNYSLQIDNSFCIKTNQGLQLYGVTDEGGIVLFLGLDNKKQLSSEQVAEVKKIIDKYKLILVDWCRMSAMT